MKIAINKCYGGFSLSAKATKRLAELNGKECFFFSHDLESDSYEPLDIKQCEDNLFWSAFSVPNPEKVMGKSKRGEDGTYKEYNDRFGEIDISSRSDNRTDKLLIQVIEELGDEVNGSCAKIKIIEIPDDIKYDIDEYDGLESIHEKHRSWE